MAKKEKTPPETKTEFIPDLSVTETGLTDALKGFDEPVIELPKDLVDVSLTDELTPTGRPKRKYTKRTKGVNPGEGDIDVIDGEDIQMFCDLVIPLAIAGIHNMTNKEKMSPDGIMLTPKQEEKMNRLAQRVADRMKVSMNPFLALAIGVSVAYGGNYMKNKP